MGVLSDFASSSILNSSKNAIRMQWDFLSKIPGGRKIFSHGIGLAAPYSGTIGAEVLEVKTGFAKVQLADRRAVRNHLSCIHAIALLNLAEIAGNLALAYSLPDDARFIVSGLRAEYPLKARGTLIAIGTSPVIDSSTRREFELPVEIFNAAGQVVTRVWLQSLVGPKKRE